MERSAEAARVYDLEPRLRFLDELVTALVALVRPGDRMCHSCIWERIIKPALLPYVGWERSLPAIRKASAPLQFLSFAELEAQTQADLITPEDESYLCSQTAWDAIVDDLVGRLRVADPGNGHGVAAGKG